MLIVIPTMLAQQPSVAPQSVK